MAEDSGFRDIKRKPKPGWERWRPPPPDRWARAGFRGKTVWDWLDLLIVPLMLALITVAFTWQQSVRQNDIEDRRAQAERELAEQRAQDEALQAYLDQMSQLVIRRYLSDSNEDAPVHALAQARTSTAILTLDAEHNQSVIRFLSDSGLVRRGETSVKLLKGINLDQAALSGAELRSTTLYDDADLIGADLRGAKLDDANLNCASLQEAKLRGAILHKAELRNAGLTRANLRATNLYKADLRGATLQSANLKLANLEAAKGWTEEQLDAAKSLKGATMPDGTRLKDGENPNGPTFEEWRKSNSGGVRATVAPPKCS